MSRELSGGAANITFDKAQFGAVDGVLTDQTEGYDEAGDRYLVTVHGGPIRSSSPRGRRNITSNGSTEESSENRYRTARRGAGRGHDDAGAMGSQE
jgi:hypothetical protein